MSAVAILHPFEEAGLGHAPFRFVGFEVRKFSPVPGITLPGSSCAYCGQAIVNCCTVRDADGRHFIVGPDCVRRTLEGVDTTLALDVRRALNDVRRAQREEQRVARHTRLMQRVASARATLDAMPELLTNAPHPFYDRAQRGETLRSWALWMLANAGDSGMAEACRLVEAMSA